LRKRVIAQSRVDDGQTGSQPSQAVTLKTREHRVNERNGDTAPQLAGPCYHCRMFNFGKPKTAGDWIVHIAGAIVAIFLVWWMLRMYVL
jgi:hypothetical protein